MAITRVATAITWSSSASQSHNSNSAFTSDNLSYDATCTEAGVLVSADNSGTPASGDVLDVWWACTVGDVLGDSGDDYETTEHAYYLGRLDTVAANTPGEDPARKWFPLPVAVKGGRLVTQAAQGATRAITVRAMLMEVRAA